MKKLAKYLVLFMALALLVSTFAVAAFADEPTPNAETEAAVGTYDESGVPDSFKKDAILATLQARFPDDGITAETKIGFVTWASEADFESGDPEKIISWYAQDTAMTKDSGVTVAVFSDSRIGADVMTVGYVHAYSDAEVVAAGTQLKQGNKSLVVCLGGNTLYMNEGWLIGNSSPAAAADFTLKDGKVSYPSSSRQVQIRSDAKMTWENLDVTIGYGSFINNGGADKVEYKNCILTATNKAAYFELTMDGSNSTPPAISFTNTDLIFTTEPSDCVFRVNEPDQKGVAELTITFDANSSVSGIPADKWFSFKEGYYYASGTTARAPEAQGQFSKTQVINFEYGFRFCDGAIPPKTYTFQDVLYDESNTASVAAKKNSPVYNISKQNSSYTVNDVQIADIRYLDAEGEPITGNFYLVRNSESDPFIVMTDLSAYSIVDIDLDTNTIYQTWTDTTLSTGSSSSALSVRDGAYLMLLKDITATYISTAADDDVTFDLNGHTFTRKSKDPTTSATTGNFQLGYGQSGKWQNERDIRFISTAEAPGNLVLESVIQSRGGSNIYFENLNITTSSNLLNDGGAQLIYIKDCTFTPKNSGYYISQSEANMSKYGDRLIILDNVQLSRMGIHKSFKTATNDQLTINITNGSTIDSSYALVACTTNANGSIASTVPTTIALNVDSDTKFTDTPTLVTIADDADVVAYHTVTTSFFSDITAKNLEDYTSSDLALKVSVTTVGTAAEEGNLINVKSGDYLTIRDKTNLGDIVLAFSIGKAGEALTYYPVIEDADGNAIITCTDIASIASGETLTFICDLTYDPKGSTSSDGRVGGYKDNITLDFGGNTFTLKHRWNLLNNTLTFKNGNVVIAAGQGFFGNPGHETDVITFDDVNISSPDCNLITLYQGKLVINGGSLTTGAYAITFSDLSKHFLEMDGVLVDAKYFVSAPYNTEYSGTPLPMSQNIFNINNCIIDVSGYAFNVSGTYAEDIGAYININISNSKIKGSGDFYNGNADLTVPLVNFSISETYLSQKPTVDTGVNLTYGTNNILMGIVDPAMSDYNYLITATKPAIGGALQTNLSLTTDFKVNFFADSAITGVYLDGTLLPNSEWEGKTKYVLDLSVEEAADAVALEVWFVSGEITYKLPLNYSVLTYAEKLVVSSASEEAKTLAKAAIAYIKEAYLIVNASTENYELPADLAAFDSAVAPVAATGELSDLPDIIVGIQLKLESETNIVLNLAAITGTVTVNGRAYEVTEGTVADGSTYIKIDMKAKDLLDDVIIEHNGVSGTFTLAGYVNSASVQGTAYEPLLEALYTYVYYANAYAVSVTD